MNVVVEGRGLHTGMPARVVLEARPHGRVTLTAGGVSARIEELSVVSTERATTVQGPRGGARIGTVEHLFAALAGTGRYAGLAITIDGPEMPLLDGGASTWCRALDTLNLHPADAGRAATLDGDDAARAGCAATLDGDDAARASSARLRVTRSATFESGTSFYRFVPGDAVEVEVHIDFADPRIAACARWNGDARDFRDRIAPARTFAFASDLAHFGRAGLARHVAPEAVVVFAPRAVHSAGAPFSPDEPARHKLLDLIGDLYVHGGVPFGQIRAVRPGHTANARAFAWARNTGVLRNEQPCKSG